MDPRRFDALVRSLVVSASRRRVLAGLLPALLPALGSVWSEEADAAKRQRHAAKRKRRSQRKKQTKKQAQKAKRRQKRAGTEAAAGCCKSGNCSPGTGKNLTKCCYENQSLSGKNFKGSNLTNANFTGANLTNAKFQSSNLTGACFVDATITGANFKQANLSGVIRCRTIINSAGDEDNSGCDRGTPCCPTCTSDTQCGDEQVCFAGRCACGHVCAGGACAFDNLADALASDLATIRLCAGLFPTRVSINRDVTIIGAGAGDNPNQDTILDGEQLGRVLDIAAGVEVTLQSLRIRNGHAEVGGGFQNAGAVTLTDCAVTDNTATGVGGGLHSSVSGATLTLERTLVARNHAGVRGGGIDIFRAALTLLAGTVVSGNTVGKGPTSGGGGGGINADVSTGGIVPNAGVIDDNFVDDGVNPPFENNCRPSGVVQNCSG